MLSSDVHKNFHINFNFNNIHYDIDLVEGKKFEHSVKINGSNYNVLCNKGNLEIACKILNSIKLISISSEDDIKNRLLFVPDISFSQPEMISSIAEIVDSIGKTILNIISTEKVPDTFKSIFKTIQTNLSHNTLIHRVFVTSNEINYKETLEALKGEPIRGNTSIYTSGLFSLDLAACERAKSDIQLENIIILDYAPVVRDFWLEIEDILQEIEERNVAKELIKDLIRRKKEIYFPQYSSQISQDSIDFIEQSINQGLSFSLLRSKV